MNRRLSVFSIITLAAGFSLLCLPVLVLVVGSFDGSAPAGWGGFSVRWYAGLLNDDGLVYATSVSIQVAILSATIAAVLGTLAAVALDRHDGFLRKSLFPGMIHAQIVMPEIITGLVLLLLFVAIDLDRGFATVVIAHTTFTLCIVAVIVQIRLRALDRALMEAAMDLGAPPARAFFSIMLPALLPAIAAGWMLAFALSLGDLVIASFTTGLGTTTLPMVIQAQILAGATPQTNALCSLLVVVVATGVLLVSIIGKTGMIQGGD